MKYKVTHDTYITLLKNIRQYFASADQNIWDKRNKIKILSFVEKNIAIKSFKIPHFINKIAYTFLRDSKAKRSYFNSLKIVEFVPKPIGYAEFKKFGLLYDSYFLCEEYAYDFTIREVLKQKNFKHRKAIFEQFAAFTYALHEKDIEHLDYSPGNILIKEIAPKAYEFKIIDVNRMRFKTYTSKERLENFSKLWADDNDLEYIVNIYTQWIDIPQKEAVKIALEASQKHKDKKLFKKKFLRYIKPKRIFTRNSSELKQAINHISVAMIAKNADETIRQSLDSLRLFDEVLVYLNESIDQTKSIALEYKNVKIVEGPFLGFGETKNAAAEASKYDWILSLDSDEILNEALLNEISQLDFTVIKNIYKLKRDNYFLGKETQNSNIIVRLYNKKYTKFDDSIVHEKIMIPKDAHVMTLKHSFTHLYILDINQTLRKIIHYTDLGSEDKKVCFFSVVVAKTIFAFFKTYILKGNFMKGWVGYALAVNSANKRHYKYLKQFINCQREKKKIV
ncbi:MAG: hypothetical protein DSZ08_00280 [Sulfurovum sp.]|nr:MAG: hypothetical protein DSZ08_00280 [Sulfurovum sp.]